MEPGTRDGRGRLAGLAGHWWDYLWGRAPVRTSLRYSFVLGLAATTLVTAFTYLAVGVGPGVEVNPVMRWVIGRHGWVGFAAVRYAVVIGVFVFLWPVSAREGHWPEWSEGNGRMAAALLWANALRDGFVLATGIVPTFVALRLLGIA